jgi:hypothetical protein
MLCELAVTRRYPDDMDERISGFGNPGPELRALLARASPFCVMADPRPLGAPAEAADPVRPSFVDRLWIRDWLARVAPLQWRLRSRHRHRPCRSCSSLSADARTRWPRCGRIPRNSS